MVTVFRELFWSRFFSGGVGVRVLAGCSGCPVRYSAQCAPTISVYNLSYVIHWESLTFLYSVYEHGRM